MKYKSFVVRGKYGINIVLDKQTKENLNIIVMKTNAFLAEPLTLEQGKELIGSIIDFYFSHDDDVEEFKDFIAYIAGFMELLADNIKRGGTCEWWKIITVQQGIIPVVTVITMQADNGNRVSEN